MQQRPAIGFPPSPASGHEGAGVEAGRLMRHRMTRQADMRDYLLALQFCDRHAQRLQQIRGQRA